jgi:hypothetical protein
MSQSNLQPIKNKVLELLPGATQQEFAKNRAMVLLHPKAENVAEFAKVFLKIDLKPRQAEALIEFFDKGYAYEELLLRWGRKGGKTLMAAITILYCAYQILMENDPHKKYGILPNQKLYALLVSVDKEQAIDVGLNYIKTLIKGSWFFKHLIVSESANRIELAKNVVIKAQLKRLSMLRNPVR